MLKLIFSAIFLALAGIFYLLYKKRYEYNRTDPDYDKKVEERAREYNRKARAENELDKIAVMYDTEDQDD